MANATRTLHLLDELTAKGFDDSAFWRLHHFRLRKAHETIASHRAYCKKIAHNSDHFQDGSENTLVQRRLAWVLAKYDKSGKPNGDTAYFCELADAAFKRLPPGSKK